MDLSQKALQTNGKLFSNFGIIFEIISTFKIILALGINACVEGRHLC